MLVIRPWDTRQTCTKMRKNSYMYVHHYNTEACSSFTAFLHLEPPLTPPPPPKKKNQCWRTYLHVGDHQNQHCNGDGGGGGGRKTGIVPTCIVGMVNLWNLRNLQWPKFVVYKYIHFDMGIWITIKFRQCAAYQTSPLPASWFIWLETFLSEIKGKCRWVIR